MTPQLDEKAIEIATMVIIHAGNAHQHVRQALNAAEKNEFKGIDSELEKANEEIKAAHKTQTDIIQSEARGENPFISLLLTHAQDTLMITMNELEIARYLIGIYHRLDELLKRNAS
jgi:PTS system cellobiose-specific IIA component